MSLSFKNIFSALSKTTSSAPNTVVGIDVGSSSIKVVELEQTDQAITLRTYGELQLGPYADQALGESVKIEQKKLTEALIDVIRESSVSAHNGVLTIPLSSSFVTVISVQTVGDEDVEAKLRVEARKYIPAPLNDVKLDWAILNQYGDERSQVYEVLLAAIQNEAFDRYQEVLQSLKMVSQPTEIEVFSTIRSVYRTNDPAIAIIDLGAETSKLYIVEEGSLQRIHRVYDGGATCTKRIADLLEIPFAEAENKKRNYHQNDEHARDIYRAYTSSIERSIQEFKRIIDEYEARQGEQLGRIVLTGGAASFPGAAAYIGDLLARQVTHAEPFDRVAYPAFMEDTLTSIGVSFATALGAALRTFESQE